MKGCILSTSFSLLVSETVESWQQSIIGIWCFKAPFCHSSIHLFLSPSFALLFSLVFYLSLCHPLPTWLGFSRSMKNGESKVSLNFVPFCWFCNSFLAGFGNINCCPQDYWRADPGQFHSDHPWPPEERKPGGPDLCKSQVWVSISFHKEMGL